MRFDRIDRLVTAENFFFQAWNNLHGKGVWAALGIQKAQVDAVRGLSKAGDWAMAPAMGYVASADWLPCVTGRSWTHAMRELEDRLASLPLEQLVQGSKWAELVDQALEALSDAAADTSWSHACVPHRLDDLPATFTLAIERSATLDRKPQA